jgi:hypothetical protein
MMVVFSLFPAGCCSCKDVLANGYWHARSWRTPDMKGTPDRMAAHARRRRVHTCSALARAARRHAVLFDRTQGDAGVIVWVDADACPADQRDRVSGSGARKDSGGAGRQSRAARTEVAFIKAVQVEHGFDVADARILAKLAAGDSW